MCASSRRRCDQTRAKGNDLPWHRRDAVASLRRGSQESLRCQSIPLRYSPTEVAMVQAASMACSRLQHNHERFGSLCEGGGTRQVHSISIRTALSELFILLLITAASNDTCLMTQTIDNTNWLMFLTSRRVGFLYVVRALVAQSSLPSRDFGPCPLHTYPRHNIRAETSRTLPNCPLPSSHTPT